MLRPIRWAACALVAGRISTAHAAFIDVFPGAGTLQAAVDAAQPRDTLRVHQGDYSGPVVIDKQLKLRHADPARTKPIVEIDAGCTSPVGLDVVADGVTMKLRTRVRGGTSASVRVHANRVRLTDVTAANNCASGDGLRIESSTDVTVAIKYWTILSGVAAGLRLVSLVSGAGVKFEFRGRPRYTEVRAESPSGVGLSIQDSGVGSALGAAGITLSRFGAVGAGSPARFVNSDGIRVTAGFNPYPATATELDASSDNNLFYRCGFSGDIVNAGAGNCHLRSSFHDAGVLPECP
jgi:hypothetical protein